MIFFPKVKKHENSFADRENTQKFQKGGKHLLCKIVYTIYESVAATGFRFV